MVCEAPLGTLLGPWPWPPYDHSPSSQRTLSLERAVEAVISISCLLKRLLFFLFQASAPFPKQPFISVIPPALPFPGQRRGRPEVSQSNKSTPTLNTMTG